MQNPVNMAVETPQDARAPYDALLPAVSWPAIFAGGLTAIALSLVLLILGSGLGFAAVSPWSNTGASTAAFTLSTIIWLIFMQWASAGVGGYITGRLRTRWLGTHPHEVFFRDTAHGLLTWAFASVLTVALLASAISTIVGGASHAAGTAITASAAHETSGDNKAAGSMAGNPFAYYVDELFRQEQPMTPPASQDVRAETARILAMNLKKGNLADNDKAYISQLVASQTGVSQEAAAQRVEAMTTEMKSDETKVKEAADAARKVSASFSIFTALSMFIGAFIACVAAALGGRCRDEEKNYVG